MVPAIRSNPTLTAWATPINRLGGVFDHLFEDSLFGPGIRADRTAMPLSLWHDDDHIYIEVDVPGMGDQDVEVTVHKGVLYIRGERKPASDGRFFYNDRSWGRFERAIMLPDEVDADAVQAELSQGVLRLALPKSPETKPRKIALKTS